MDKLGKMISLLILPLIAIIVYSSLKGFFLNRTPIWTFEVSIFLFGCFFMLGAAYCHMLNNHVSVDVVNHYLPPKWRRIFGIFGEIVVLFVVLVMIYLSVPTAIRSTIMKERSTHQTPFNPQVWWYRWVIPISCALMSWQSFKNMMRLIFQRPDDMENEKGV
ncbi:Tripartite ATP-independent periplasmic transporter DctQ component [Thermovirga lienii DSM 17291]|jgi:TRAP-type C4-dicarboxylate transport system permease small subunit|uniref:Tripartite ATP-independent periplasmic transporter DctQ component n=1 Tax=Thermovirga lienii (strain ATCC BAA-1197 / DSM 17291 / Cas60314) TaxID=580340 RepID=G7V5E4_THELD|nr:TRAP transporter small permease [Thermovirga lienii]AER65771.1 Tripartite ATP-independent periplasmic transporter DctQ component [Thermovirga lienii DSM 17291]KUK42837.1 MAG: Tripartite ATP-independent periplasmic transporter DctQ component [Thermovirga lienii]HCD71769.1 TRAP transporter small permease [Thermovirga lienii]